MRASDGANQFLIAPFAVSAHSSWTSHSMNLFHCLSQIAVARAFSSSVRQVY